LLDSRHWDMVQSRRHTLEAWVMAGGRLIVSSGALWANHWLQDWSGVAPAVAADDEPAADTNEKPKPRPRKKSALDIAMGADTCAKAVVPTGPDSDPFGRSEYLLCIRVTDAALASHLKPAWVIEADDGPTAVRVPRGRGSVTLLASDEVFDNRGLTRGDNALLLASAAQFHTQDFLWMVRDAEGESLHNLAWRLGAPAVVLLCLSIGAMLMRGMRRFGPLARVADPARRSLAEQIRGTGSFAWRMGDLRTLHEAELRALAESARAHVRGYDALPPAERAAAIAAATGLTADAIGAAMSNRGGLKRAALREQLAQMEAARRLLVVRSKAQSRFS
jgi:hypothetical protein